MIEICAAQLQDVQQIYALGSSVPEFLVNQETVNFWPLDTLRNAIESNDVSIIVAHNGDMIVGFILATYNYGLKKATIENVFVDPKFRGQNVGQLLLKKLLNTIETQGCEYVATLIPNDADEASELYLRAGFHSGETFLWLDKSLSSVFKRG